MKKSELEDIILEETLKLLEEEGETLNEERLDELVGLLGRGALGLGRLAWRRGAEQAARQRAQAALARSAVRGGATPAAARQQAAQRMAQVDDARELQRLGMGRRAAATATNLPRGYTQLGTTPAQRAGYESAFRGTGSRLGDWAVGVPTAWAAGVGREGGIIPDIPDDWVPGVSDLPGVGGLGDAVEAAQQAYSGLPSSIELGDPEAIAAARRQLQQMAQTGAESLGDVATTVAGGGRPPVGIAGPVGTTQARPPAMPTQSQRQAALASTRPTQAPRQPATTSPAPRQPAPTSPASGKLAAAQDTWTRSGGAGRLPVAEGSDLPNVRPAWTVSENNKEYNSDMKFKRSQLEAMILEELQGLLNEQEGEEEYGWNPLRNMQVAQRQAAEREERENAPASTNREEYLASQARMATPTPEGAAEATRAQGLGQADLPIPRSAAPENWGIDDVDPEGRLRLMRYVADQGRPLETSMHLNRGDREAAAAMGIPTQGGPPIVAADTEQEEERPRRRRSRREEPADEPAAAPSAKPTGATAAGKGPGATAAGKGPGAAGKGPGAAGKGTGEGETKVNPLDPASRFGAGPATGKEAAAWEDPEPERPGWFTSDETDAAHAAWSEREAARGRSKGAGGADTANPMGRPTSDVRRRRDPRQSSGGVSEGQVRKTMSTLKEGFSKYLPKK